MKRLFERRLVLTALSVIAAGCGPSGTPGEKRAETAYDELTTLFEEWRSFQRPDLIDGVPDYTARAMTAQFDQLPSFRRRLHAIDPTDWPVAQRVDYHIVQAEMNGLEFDHQVLRPWARNPAFYRTVFPSQSDVPAREGPVAYGAIEIWDYEFPLQPEGAARLTDQLRTIPPLLDQARTNLVEDARELWNASIRTITRQSSDLDDLTARVLGTDSVLEAAIQHAREATDEFGRWLERQAPSKHGPSGVGIENWNWYMRNVHLVPFTWDEVVTMMRRELYRAHAFLALEEHRNRSRPQLTPIATAREYDRRLNDAVTEYMAFLEEEEIVSIRDYMDRALRERIGSFSPHSGIRPFFSQVTYHDPVVMRTHGYHWFDLARMSHEPHASPIRRVPLLYNIFDSRAEGLATGMEEMMMHAGLFDNRPRARELIYILLAQRAARALGGLMQHANRFTLQEAAEFASEWTPRGWLPADSSTIQGEQHFYLQQPGYGTSYLVGKIQIERLMAERVRQLGSEFSVKRFMDELNGAGVIPMSLVHWELTGDADAILDMRTPPLP